MKLINKKTIILSLFFIGAGAILMIIGYLLGGRAGLVISETGISSVPDPGKTYKLEKTKLDSFSKTDIKIDYAEISILPSEDDHFYLEYLLGNSSGEPVYKVSQNTFTMEQKEKGFNILVFGSISYSNPDPYVRLYIPESADMEQLNMNIESGTTLFENIKADSCNLDFDYGDVTMKNAEFDTLTIDFESIDTTLNTVKANTLTINGQYGSMNLKNMSCKSSSFNLESIDVNLDAASLENLDYKNEYGSLVLILPEKTDTYSFDVVLEYGDLLLPHDISDDINTDEDGKQHYTTEGTKNRQINIETESGDVDIRER